MASSERGLFAKGALKEVEDLGNEWRADKHLICEARRARRFRSEEAAAVFLMPGESTRKH